MLEETLKDLQCPGKEFRGAPFWAWNGKLEPEVLRSQIREMKKMGLGGFFMHSRVGMNTPYLQDKWFDCVKACTDEAEKNGMNAWLYDEDRWPSGAAGGIVTKNPAYRMRVLLCDYSENAKKNEDGETLAWAALRFVKDDEKELDSYRQLSMPDSVLKPDEILCRFYCMQQKKSSWYNDQTYLDTMNPEAVQKFIEVTHDTYKKEMSDEFGKNIPGIFADEPNYFGANPDMTKKAIPWTDKIPELFQKKYDYDLTPKLPELFFPLEGKTFYTVRLHFMNLITDCFVHAFSKQIGEWCEKNNLLFTGHVLCEDTVSNQAREVGSAMRFYEYMGAPGIDLLTEHWNIFNTAKQCSSMAHQFGKKTRLSETYGCTGWDFPFMGHKALGDWQYALGINFRCQHLAWYTMEAEAKRDYPASIFYQSPWYKHYSKVEDYFARLGSLLREGEEVRNLLVIHPIESYFGEALFGEVREDMDQKLVHLTNKLLSAHLDFDFGEEEVMSRNAFVKEKTLFVQKAKYQAVLIPPLTTIRSSTLKLLKQFTDQFGQVFYMGAVPQYVDGLPSEKAEKCYLKFRAVDDEKFADILSISIRQVSIQNDQSKEIPAILYNLHETEDAKILFCCNLGMVPDDAMMNAPLVRDRTMAFPHAKISLDGFWNSNVYEVDLNTGDVLECNAAVMHGKCVINASFAPLESHLYIITEKELEVKERPVLLTGFSGVNLLGSAPWKYSLSEDNVLVLDHADCQIEGKCFAKNEYILTLDDKLREKLGERPRGGKMIQPWLRDYSKYPDLEVVPELTYHFTVNDIPEENCRLAIEHPEFYCLALNGQMLTQKPVGYWVDPIISCLSVPKELFQEGENTLVAYGKYNKLKPGLETIFILGKFGVDKNAITKMPEMLKIGDWCEQGFSNYAGNMTYIREVTLAEIPAQPVVLRLPSWRGSALVIQVNEQPEVTIGWPPYQLDVQKSLQKGLNQIKITVLGHRRNAFGPFYQKDKWPAWTGWDSFKRQDQKERQLVPCGLLEDVLLQLGQ